MSRLVQFKLSAQDSERAFEALERSPARNLNMLAKEVFLQFLANQDGQAGHLSGIAHSSKRSGRSSRKSSTCSAQPIPTRSSAWWPRSSF